MSLDVMRNPSFVVSELRWYKPAETTPFALCGHLGPVLVHVDPEKYGSPVIEVWFFEGGWENGNGEPFEEADILAFAIPSAPDEITRISRS